MAARKIRHRAWEQEDVREFKKLARAKAGARKIAKTFKRTEGAIRQKALQLGVSLSTRATKARRR